MVSQSRGQFVKSSKTEKVLGSFRFHLEKPMETQSSPKALTKLKSSCRSTELVLCCTSLLVMILLLFHLRTSFNSSFSYSRTSSASRAFLIKWKGLAIDSSSSSAQDHSKINIKAQRLCHFPPSQGSTLC